MLPSSVSFVLKWYFTHRSTCMRAFYLYIWIRCFQCQKTLLIPMRGIINIWFTVALYLISINKQCIFSTQGQGFYLLQLPRVPSLYLRQTSARDRALFLILWWRGLSRLGLWWHTLNYWTTSFMFFRISVSKCCHPDSRFETFLFLYAHHLLSCVYVCWKMNPPQLFCLRVKLLYDLTWFILEVLKEMRSS